jgi:acetate kinase
MSAILVINSGSSSLKFGLYEHRDNDECSQFDSEVDMRAGEETAAMARALTQIAKYDAPIAIGHRVVHGGPRLTEHQRITPRVLDELRASTHFAPLHSPEAIALIESAGRAYPDVPQFACFDTAFHHTMPESATRFALPRGLYEEGVKRYGFHGISYESIVHQLGDRIPPRCVIAHLGSGASLCAVKDGRSIDTTMGLTPTGGIPMATRVGDLDPGVLLYLMRAKNMQADAIEQMVNRESGLKGLCHNSDMREIEKSVDAGDVEARLALDIFCTRIRKTIGAYAALMGGLDLLVFAGGIGEHSDRVRSTVVQGLKFMGDFRTEVVASQEDIQIARHARAMLASDDGANARKESS